jgi:hypothetical protein
MKRKARTDMKNPPDLEVRIEYRAVPDEESARRLGRVFDLLLKNLEDDVNKTNRLPP